MKATSRSATNPLNKKFRGSLGRSILRTLLVFTFIPLILMASAAYLRARNLLQEQVVGQTQSLVAAQAAETRNVIQIKQIRLDRIIRRMDFGSAMQALLHDSGNSAFVMESRVRLDDIFTEASQQASSPIFNQYLVLDPDGKILASSKREWEGLSLAESDIFLLLEESDNQTFGYYGLEGFYPDQFVLLTVEHYRTSDGVSRALVVGITEPRSIAEILGELAKSAQSSKAYLVSAEGEYIGIDPYTSLLSRFAPSEEQKTNVDAALALQMGASERIPATLTYDNSSGESVLTQVIWMPEMQMGLALEIPQAVIFGQLNSLVPFTALIFLAAFTAMALVLNAGTKRVIKPILALSETTRRFAEGDLQERAPINSNDEIGLLADSFNRMADDLGRMYQSLQEQVDQRTRQIRAAAEVAQSITTAVNLDELLRKTVGLIVERFGYYHAGIFMIDSDGKYATIRAAHGPTAGQLLGRGHRLEVGSASIIGWVAAKNQPRVASDVEEDPVHLKNELLPETRAEAAVPIASGSLVMGVLDVQSTVPDAFDEEAVVVLQTLANQIAAAIQNSGLIDTAHVNVQEAERLYSFSRQFVAAETKEEVMQMAARALKHAPFFSIVVDVRETGLQVIAINDPADESLYANLPADIEGDPAAILQAIGNGMIVPDLQTPGPVPPPLVHVLTQSACETAALLPIAEGHTLHGLLVLGGRPQQPLSGQALRPYAIAADVMTAVITRIAAMREIHNRVTELEALTTISQALSTVVDIDRFYASLHEQVKRVIGDYDFALATYDQDTNTIQVPYMVEQEKITSVEPFPLGEGLTSVLIRTRQPLLLTDIERQSAELGAKVIGKPAKSWIGTPLMIGAEAVGALIVQDLDRKDQFTESDLKFLTALAGQVSGVIQTVRALEQSRRSALQLQTAAEIARDISGSLNLDELLARAVNLIRDRFDYYHAAIFLLDLPGEFAVIREATGEAGAQMKRTGHKLGVGSKSIVGYVAGRGERLIVNDTSKDATYFANPLLPETRAEAAIPLKVGERILGVLDVQSNTPYAFSEEKLRTLQILADQLGVAVVNTELFADTQEHLSQHRLLHHITTSAASGATLEEALETAVKGLQVTLGGDRVTILLVDSERKYLEVKAAVGYSQDATSLRVPIGTGITGWVAAHRRLLRLDDVTADPRYIQLSANTRSELAVPLLYRNELLGVLNVESEQLSAYTENDEEMLGTLGGSLAAVIANARLLEQIRRQADRERLLYEVTSRIRRSTDMQTILATTASELTRATGARRTRIKIEPQTDAVTPGENPERRQ